MINTYYKIYRTYQLSINFLYFTEMVQVFNKLSVYIVMSKITIFLNFWVIIFLKANKGLPLPVILMNLKCFQNDLIKFIEQGEKMGN